MKSFHLFFLLTTLMSAARADEKAPAIPDIQNYDTQATRLNSANRLDSASQAINRMPRVPNINTPKQGIDVGQIAARYNKSPLMNKAEDNLLVFVSLSMPKDALIKLALQAKATNAILVMRGVEGGLSKGNWPRAMNALKPISDTGATIIIHPDYYKQFKVTQVPTFVLTSAKMKDGCSESTLCVQHLQAVGDVTLDYVLERWANNQDDLGKLAKSKLAMIGDSHE